MKRILVVGGGVIGMLSALELARAGQLVQLFDRADTGRESSWAGGGIISPLFPWRYFDSVTHLASWGQRHYANLATTLAQHTGVDPEYTECGLILVAPDETEAAEKWAEQHHRQMAVIDAEEFHRLEPHAAEPTEALWMPAVGQVRNPRLARALRRRLEQLGVDIRTDSEVHALLQTNGRCQGVDSSSGRFAADVVIVCAGAWSGRLLADLPAPPAIAPMRGQMLMFKAEPGTISRMVLESNRYVIPRRDGRT